MKTGLFVPIDQSKFDHVPSKRVLKAAFEMICRLGVASGDVERAKIAKILIERLETAQILYDGVIYNHLRGLLSGWKWTALMGTLINYAEYLGVTGRAGIPRCDRNLMCVQGDDSLLFVKGWTEANKLVREYMDVLPVNPSKFFVDKKRTEYLRLVLTPQGRFGYFARAASGLMYANAWAGGAMSPASAAQTWSLLCSRGAEKHKTVEHCLRDICGLLRCNKQEANRLLHTPTTLGGLGWTTGENRDGGYLGLKEHKRIMVGGREVVATDVEKIPRMVRRLAVANLMTHGGLLKTKVMSDAAFEGIATGVQGFEKEDVKVQLVDLKEPELPKNWAHEADSYFTPKPPRTLIDPMMLEPLVRRFVDKKDDVKLEDIFERAEIPMIRLRYRRWNRTVWFDWVTGRLTPTVGRRWGDAPDVLAHLKEKLIDRGLIPTGKVKLERIKAREFKHKVT